MTQGSTKGDALRAYARDDGTRVRIVADDTRIIDGRLIEIEFFRTAEDAIAAAAWCAAMLERSHMPADTDGWHPYPAVHLPKLLKAAANAVWAGSEPARPALPQTPPDRPPRPRWTRERDNWLCFLAGQGLTAKQIAADPSITATANAVFKRANRIGISLSAAQQGTVSFRATLATMAVIDRAAALEGLTRSGYLRRWVEKCAADPVRWGMIGPSA